MRTVGGGGVVLACARRGVLQRSSDVLRGLLRGRHQLLQLLEVAVHARALLRVLVAACVPRQRLVDAFTCTVDVPRPPGRVLHQWHQASGEFKKKKICFRW